jgi:hypothetical protein
LKVHGLRFRRDVPGLLVVKKDELLAWDPDAGTLDSLARADGLVDADIFRGGIVTLVAKPDPSDPPRRR